MESRGPPSGRGRRRPSSRRTTHHDMSCGRGRNANQCGSHHQQGELSMYHASISVAAGRPSPMLVSDDCRFPVRHKHFRRILDHCRLNLLGPGRAALLNTWYSFETCPDRLSPAACHSMTRPGHDVSRKYTKNNYAPNTRSEQSASVEPN